MIFTVTNLTHSADAAETEPKDNKGFLLVCEGCAVTARELAEKVLKEGVYGFVYTGKEVMTEVPISKGGIFYISDSHGEISKA